MPPLLDWLREKERKEEEKPKRVSEEAARKRREELAREKKETEEARKRFEEQEKRLEEEKKKTTDQLAARARAGMHQAIAKKKAAEKAKRTYVVKSGDSLSKIAKEVYEDANRWSEIYEANKELIGDNPNLIHPGQ